MMSPQKAKNVANLLTRGFIDFSKKKTAAMEKQRGKED